MGYKGRSEVAELSVTPDLSKDSSQWGMLSKDSRPTCRVANIARRRDYSRERLPGQELDMSVEKAVESDAD